MIGQVAALCASLVLHEGVRTDIYLDHLGNKTVGIGHLIEPHEEEYSMPVGTYLPYDRVIQLFASDCEEAYRGALRVVDGIDEYPQDIQNIITEMVFQMGTAGVLKFRNMRAALEQRDYATAANEMLDSRWARQTPSRAEDLARRMEAHHVAY